ncbi:MAG: hypothetical protein AB7N54_13095 [Alphaproteobacteria bacterium]
MDIVIPEDYRPAVGVASAVPPPGRRAADAAEALLWRAEGVAEGALAASDLARRLDDLLAGLDDAGDPTAAAQGWHDAAGGLLAGTRAALRRRHGDDTVASEIFETGIAGSLARGAADSESAARHARAGRALGTLEAALDAWAGRLAAAPAGSAAELTEAADNALDAALGAGLLDAGRTAAARRAFRADAGERRALALIAAGQGRALAADETLLDDQPPARRAALLRAASRAAGGDDADPASRARVLGADAVAARRQAHLDAIATSGAGLDGIARDAEAALDAEALAQFRDAERAARDAHAVAAALAFAPRAALDRARAAPAGGEDDAGEADAGDAVAAALDRLDARRAGDPLGLALEEPSVARLARGAAADPGRYPQVLDRALALQRRMEVGRPRVLTAGERAALAAGLVALPAPERLERLRAERARLGHHWPAALEELAKEGIDPGTRALARDPDAPWAPALAAALATPVHALRAAIGEDEARAVTDAITARLGAGDAGGPLSGERRLAERHALHLAATVADPDSAADIALRQLRPALDATDTRARPTAGDDGQAARRLRDFDGDETLAGGAGEDDIHGPPPPLLPLPGDIAERHRGGAFLRDLAGGDVALAALLRDGAPEDTVAIGDFAVERGVAQHLVETLRAAPEDMAGVRASLIEAVARGELTGAQGEALSRLLDASAGGRTPAPAVLDALLDTLDLGERPRGGADAALDTAVDLAGALTGRGRVRPGRSGASGSPTPRARQAIAAEGVTRAPVRLLPVAGTWLRGHADEALNRRLADHVGLIPTRASRDGAGVLIREGVVTTAARAEGHVSNVTRGGGFAEAQRAFRAAVQAAGGTQRDVLQLDADSWRFTASDGTRFMLRTFSKSGPPTAEVHVHKPASRVLMVDIKVRFGE